MYPLPRHGEDLNKIRLLSSIATLSEYVSQIWTDLDSMKQNITYKLPILLKMGTLRSPFLSLGHLFFCEHCQSNSILRSVPE